MCDEEIIALYWQRAEEAIRATAQKYGSYCYSIAHSILARSEDAEECVSDTWLRAWNAIPPQRPRNLAVWLGRIVRNLSLDRLRRLSAEKRGGGQGDLVLGELEECIPAAQQVENVAEDREITRAIERFLHRQTPQKRRIFLRRYWFMDPLRTIADEMNLSENQIASILFRMRRALRQFLEKEGITL